MSRAVGTDRHPAVCAGNHHIEICVADRGANLIQIAGRSERSVSSEDGQLPFLGQTRRRGSCGLLGDAHADPAVLALGM